MSEKNKTYRVNTKVGVGINSAASDKYLTINLNDTFDTIEVLSLKIRQENVYRVHSSQYGVIVGRAVANGGFGVPNVKVSVFIPRDAETADDPVKNFLYPYTTSTSKNADRVRYNLLPSESDDDCYQTVGTFPTKRMVLDDNNYLEVFDKYYKYTTRTNASGDYMIFGVPVGSQTIHTDMDLSDVGVLSQKPRDFTYKGYSRTQFETPNQFKASTNLAELPQIVSQDGAVYVYPFWGDTNENIIGITRYDIDIDYKFEPTCVFMGSIVSDTGNNKLSKRCVPSENMGVMEELVTGQGTIEMIRKTITGSVEEFAIQGNQLIDDHGVWCYQIPMNLDYVMTDEYGNLVPSDNPEKGIPTRARVRFRVSMNDLQEDASNTFRGKVLVPNNPKLENGAVTPDYIFGTLTDESSYRDLLWNNIYTVKSFIPRFQKNNSNLNRRFSGIKQCNYYGSNNPIPYNNIRVRLSFQFRIACLLVKILLKIIGAYNKIVSYLSNILSGFGVWILPEWANKSIQNVGKRMSCLTVDGSLCSTLDGEWAFAPGCSNSSSDNSSWVWKNALKKLVGSGEYVDEKRGDGDDKNSIDWINAPNPTRVNNSYDYIMARGIDYFKQCVEISLAEEYKVIQFDFYNDWLNGAIYIPKWERHISRKRTFFIFGPKKTKIRACTDTYKAKRVNLTEQCAISVNLPSNVVSTPVGCTNKTYECHKKSGRRQAEIFGNGAAVHEELTSSKKYAYYFKPCEVYRDSSGVKKINLFATDLVLLGSLNPYNISETPVFIDGLETTSYKLPSPLVLTDSEEEGEQYTLKGGANILTYNDAPFAAYITDDDAMAPFNNGKIAEESGIDWAFAGNGQGKNQIAANYTPGGHFIGISCMNAQTTTKTCINLRRICEIGVFPSSSYKVPTFSGETETAAQVVTNGLISKDEITSNDFRKLFATLNYNSLQVEFDETGIAKYSFTGLSPENFGGEMASYTSENYNSSVPNEEVQGFLEDENANSERITSVIRRSSETKDDDYIRFRYGANKLTSSNFIFNNSLPIFENSYYFFFGLHNGSSALDYLRRDLFAECPVKSTGTNLKAFLYSGTTDVFESGIELGYFDGTGATTNYLYFSVNSENYPITIQYSGNLATINDKTELDYDGRYHYPAILGEKIPIGINTYSITDSLGKTIIKTVKVYVKAPEVCSSATTANFVSLDWVTKKGSLLNGGSPTRKNLGGYIYIPCQGLFKPEPSGEWISTSSASIILVNGTRVLYTSRSLDSDYLGLYFPNLSQQPGLTCGNDFIPVDETGVYDVYVVIHSGNLKSIPILIYSNMIIGEPEGAVDFTIFRRAVSSPEEAVNSYRLSYVEFSDNTWYRNIDGLSTITEEQKWYLKKDVFITSNEDALTMLYVIPFSEDNVLPNVYINDQERNYFTKQNASISERKVVLKNPSGEVICPFGGNPFPFKCVTKRFEFGKTLYWEGYNHPNSIFTRTAGNYFINGYLTYVIKNGITYLSSNERTFGDVTINGDNTYASNSLFKPTQTDSIRSTLSNSISISEPIRSGRAFFSVTEGHPETYDYKYSPETIEADASMIGSDENWSAYFEIYVKSSGNTQFGITINNVLPLSKTGDDIYTNSGEYVDGANINFYVYPTSGIIFTEVDMMKSYNYNAALSASHKMRWNDERECLVYNIAEIVFPDSGYTVYGESHNKNGIPFKTRNIVRNNLILPKYAINDNGKRFNLYDIYKKYKDSSFTKKNEFKITRNSNCITSIKISLPFYIEELDAFQNALFNTGLLASAESVLFYFIDGGANSNYEKNTYYYIDLRQFCEPDLNSLGGNEYSVGFLKPEEITYDPYPTRDITITNFNRPVVNPNNPYQATREEFDMFCLRMKDINNFETKSLHSRYFKIVITLSDIGRNDDRGNSTAGFKITEYVNVYTN